MNKVISIVVVVGAFGTFGCGGGEGFSTATDMASAGAVSKTTVSGAAGKVVGVSGSAGVAGGYVAPVAAGAGNGPVVAGSGNAPVAAGAAGQDPTNPTCRPKTCATIAVELSKGNTEAKACGNAPDGCGGYVDCGNPCGTDPGMGCGLLSITNDGYDIKNPNLCGGLCFKVTYPLTMAPRSTSACLNNSAKTTTYWCPGAAYASVAKNFATCDSQDIGFDVKPYCCAN